jgi:ATP-dependent RNA helicase MSS116, mitochondrial
VEQDEEDEALKLGVEKNGGETGGVDGSYHTSQVGHRNCGV